MRIPGERYNPVTEKIEFDPALAAQEEAADQERRSRYPKSSVTPEELSEVMGDERDDFNSSDAI